MGKPPPIMATAQAKNPAQPALRQQGLPQQSLHAQALESCAQGRLPERYSRNGNLTSPHQQAMLLRGRVLLVGLGGLGGHVLDGLIRMGVGHITGVDGDSFEASNLNRQLLCTHDTLGMSKAQAAAAHVARVNPGTHFVAVARCVRGPDLHALVRGKAPELLAATVQGQQNTGYDLVVDALGGLDDRGDLHAAALAAGIPVVAAGIAGLTGWVQTLQGQTKSPVQYFSPQRDAAPTGEGHSGSAEQLLGNLAPTVCVAAGVQCAQVYALLTGAKTPTTMLVFDVQDLYFTTLTQPCPEDKII